MLTRQEEIEMEIEVAVHAEEQPILLERRHRDVLHVADEVDEPSRARSLRVEVMGVEHSGRRQGLEQRCLVREELGDEDRVIALIIVAADADADEGDILTATANGYGKRTPVTDFPAHGRGGQGVIAIQTNERNGEMVGALQVTTDDEVMLISAGGTLVRTEVAGISIMGRNTQGVRLIRVQDGDTLVGMERIGGLNGDHDIESSTNPANDTNPDDSS